MYKIKENELRNLYENQKLSTRQIAEIFSCSFPVILNRLEKYSIPRRKSYWKWGWIAKNDNPNKGKKFPDRGMKCAANPFFGKHHSEETLKLIRLHNEEYWKTHSVWNKGLTKETNKVVRQYGLSISEKRKGKFKKEDNPNWHGGVSKEPYPFDFDKELKESIRKRDNYKCLLCGKPEIEDMKKLHIHHIDYDKKNLDPKNLISLCNSCHSKTVAHREFWKNKLSVLV